MKLDVWVVAVGVVAVGGAANGVWMLIDPAQWYEHLPAGVPDTGPLNAHFVRDIGCAFLTMSVALAWALWKPAVRSALVGIAACFYVAHAILHVHDTLRGLVDSGHWLLDLPGVYLPALLLMAAAYRWQRKGDQAVHSR